MIRAVFFDCDDTLVDFAAAARHGLVQALGPRTSYADWLELSRAHYPRYTTGEVDFQTMRDERMAAFLAALGRPADAHTAAVAETVRMSSMEARYALFDDALPCIAALRRRGLRLGVITNNEGQHQRRKLQLTGLDVLVDEIVISGEVGVAKPDPVIFDLACTRIGVPAGEAMHVGDRLGDDAVAATAAGLSGVWLARAEIVEPDQARRRGAQAGVPVITGLDEVAERLDAVAG